MLLAVHDGLGALYLLPTLAASAWFVGAVVRLRRGAASERARAAFMTSNFYLVIVMGAMMIDVLLG